MNDGFVNALKGRMIEAGKEALRQFAARHVDRIRERIGIPVEYHGGTVIRSLPGESPRKDSGDLWESVKATEPVYMDGVIDVFIYTDLLYAKWLEDGTRNMAARPWWALSVREMIDHADELKSLYEQQLTGRQPALASAL